MERPDSHGMHGCHLQVKGHIGKGSYSAIASSERDWTHERQNAPYA